MTNKFKISLTWHNCQSYPPSEAYNERLWVTDGEWVFPVHYSRIDGWYDIEAGDHLAFELLWKYYWADLNQTVRGCLEFKEVEDNE